MFPEDTGGGSSAGSANAAVAEREGVELHGDDSRVAIGTGTESTPSLPAWLQGISDEKVRGEKSLHTIKDLNSLASEYVKSQRELGSRVKLPTKDSKPEEVRQFLSKIGVPESPDKYQIKDPMVPEYAQWDKNAQKEFAGFAHKLGMTNGQLQGVVDWYSQYIAKTIPNPTDGAKKSMESLSKEWGDMTQRKLALASRAIEYYGGDALKTELNKVFGANGERLGNSPLLAKVFATIGERMLEQGEIRGEGSELESKGDLEQKVKDVYNDKKHAFWVKDHPDHQKAVDEMQRWYRAIHGVSVIGSNG